MAKPRDSSSHASASPHLPKQPLHKGPHIQKHQQAADLTLSFRRNTVAQHNTDTQQCRQTTLQREAYKAPKGLQPSLSVSLPANCRSQKPVQQKLRHHNKPIQCVTFGPAASQQHSCLRQWDAPATTHMRHHQQLWRMRTSYGHSFFG